MKTKYLIAALLFISLSISQGSTDYGAGMKFNLKTVLKFYVIA
jgi:hypothetical protein